MFKKIIQKLFKRAKGIKVGTAALDKKVDDHLAAWEKKATVVASEVDEAIREISSEVSEAKSEIKKAATGKAVRSASSTKKQTKPKDPNAVKKTPAKKQTKPKQ
jgi:hypothetical protein